MDELQRNALLMALTGQQMPWMNLREGEWDAANQRLHPADGMSSLGNIPIPQMHQGKMFNLGGRSWGDGSAQSLDFYLQPTINPLQGRVGIAGGGLLFRKTW